MQAVIFFPSIPIPELSEEELESFFACPGLTTAFAGLEVFFTRGCLAGGLLTTFFSSSELESKQKDMPPVNNLMVQVI